MSCTHIAADLGLDPTQVRKDLAVTGIIGKPKIGYDLQALVGAIETYLGWNNVTDAFLVGVGSLGRALLGYQGFAAYGLNIVAAFDCDPAKVGKVVHGKQVLPVEKLVSLTQRMKVRIGVLTVPAASGQVAADLMVRAGIVAIWNFSTAQLEVPAGVIVENVDLSASLAVLSRKLAEALR